MLVHTGNERCKSEHSLKVCDWISPKPTKSPLFSLFAVYFLLWHTASNHVICQKGTDTDTLLCRLSSTAGRPIQLPHFDTRR